MNLNPSSVCFFGEPAEQVAEALIEEGLEISLLCPVCVKLQKEIVANGWGKIEPLPHS